MNPQIQAKRARELAVKQKRERANEAEVTALRAAGIDPYAGEPEHSTAASSREAGKRDG